MATVIKFRASNPRGKAKPPVKVKQGVDAVAKAVNAAKARQESFLAVTNADTGKGITINPSLVIDIAQE